VWEESIREHGANLQLHIDSSSENWFTTIVFRALRQENANKFRKHLNPILNLVNGVFTVYWQSRTVLEIILSEVWM
jgi:hypothetical protein